MDAITRTRMQLRNDKLAQTLFETQEKLELGKITEEDLITTKRLLEHAIEVFDKDLRLCSEHMVAEEFSNYLKKQLEAEEVLVVLNSISEIHQKGSIQQSSSTTKLPKLELTKFNGDILQWSEFWDKFEANIHNKKLEDVEKLSYLMTCLEGIALETIGGLATTNSNYSIALDILRKRFGSADRVIDAHHKALSSLEMASKDSRECRQTFDTIEKHLRVLQTLGEDLESNHLRVTIVSKFPEHIMYQVNLLSSEDHTVPTLRSNLERIITAMERSERVDHNNTQEDKPPTLTTEALQVSSEIQGDKPVFKRKYNNFNQGPPYKRKRKCIFCNFDNHNSSSCKKYKTVEARKEKIKDRCSRCLSDRHKNCGRDITCYSCKGNHLMLLCPKEEGGKLDCSKVTKESDIPTTVGISSNNYTFLQTGVAKIKNPCNKKCVGGRILLDSGSQRSYITSKIAKTLCLSSTKRDSLLIYTFGAATPQELSSPSTEIIIETKREINIKLQVNIVPRITDRVPVAKFKHKDVDITADDDSLGEGIDVLVGNDRFCSLIRSNKIKVDGNLYFVDTDLGWVLSGNMSHGKNDRLSVTTYCQCHIPSCPYFTEPDLPLRNIDIKFLWSLENIGITDSPKASRQEQAVHHFNETVKYKDGRYEVKWPWIQYPPELPSNFGLSMGRLRGLIKKLDRNSMAEYDNILKEQMELGIIEIIDPCSDQKKNPIHYLPHHMVKQKGKRGRLVYDASAKIAGQKSLNECLYSGPSMLEDLTALLLKFRTNRIGIVADVEKAFLQVSLQQEDRDVTRFLWIKDISQPLTEENLVHLRFCRVPFGIISSPFLLMATIRYHMSLSNRDLLKTIADKCYVDNLVTGADTIQEASQTYEQTRSTFKQLSMNIRDWVSNNKQFMNKVPQQYKATQCNEFKVLGLTWDVKNDMLKIKVSDASFEEKNAIHTKRQVLRTLARVYDPCGFICPLVLPIKLLFQEICKEKIKWDVKLPDNLLQHVENILENLKMITKTEIPRYMGKYIENPPELNRIYQLHCFTDASKHAYAAVVYLKTIENQQTSVSFVMAKSRISQIQDSDDLKIPKLELLGFLIGSRLLQYVKNSLDLPIKKEYLWTDSMVVLGWMRSTKLLPPFVANRINEIKNKHPQTEMCYIHTKSNPADIATRPEPKLWNQKQQLWFNGPMFLSEKESQWPLNHTYDSHKTLLLCGEGLDGGSGVLEPSDWSELINIHNVPEEIEDLQVETSTSSENLLDSSSNIKKLQLQHFPDELAGKETNLSRNLDLFVDTEGVLRCGGRMTNTTWSFDMKHPILIPKECEFTNKVINETHENNYHVGVSHTLSIIRERYWIPQGRAKVGKILRKCQQCMKHGGGPYKLPAAPSLPLERVNYNEPFSYSGVDYFGPLYVNSEKGKEKRWVALFTCLTVRAIHLEIVKDLSAEECLLALRRFVATRGLPKRIYSDNAPCFRLTSEVMTSSYCIEKKIMWKFIPQLAPWHGGFYERLVGLVKHCLKRTLEKHMLNDSKLLTVMKEVEAVINTRPLTRVGTEIEHILRPADFLSLGKCLPVRSSQVEAPSTSSRLKTELIESWKRGIKILEEFKRMFVGQYLTCLRERSQHLPKQPRIRSDRSPQIGDVVQIKSDSKNRLNWKVGKIVDLIEGIDGSCRVAKVQTKDLILTRSIGHLYPIEEDSKDSSQSLQSDQILKDTSSNKLDQPDLDADLEPIETPPVDVEPIYKALCPGSNNEEIVPEEFIEINPVDVPEETSQSEVRLRMKRDAAVRAREKIREWTRHLLAILQ